MAKCFFIQDPCHYDKTATGEIRSKILWTAFSKAFHSKEIQQDTEEDIREWIIIRILFWLSFFLKVCRKVSREIFYKMSYRRKLLGLRELYSDHDSWQGIAKKKIFQIAICDSTRGILIATAQIHLKILRNSKTFRN